MIRIKGEGGPVAAVKERPKVKAATGGAKVPPLPPAQVTSSGDPKKTMSVLVTGVPVEWTKAGGVLDRARAAGGYRSRNALILALLEAALGAGK